MIAPVESSLVESRVQELLKALGLDLESSGLKDTSKRIAKMYKYELFRGLYEECPEVTVFPNEKNYDQMVVLENIRMVSTCSHHFLPFIGCAHVGYLPDKKICGISKLARVVDYFARRPQIQEELTQQIADFLEKKLEPLGVMVVVEAKHMCMMCRGIQESQVTLVTSAIKGVFDGQEARNEFLRLIGK